MARKFTKLPSLANVQAGSTATLIIPRGVTYDNIHLEYTGVTLAQITNIEVLINGKVIQSFTDGVRLQAINKHYKRNIKAGVLTFHFVRPEMENLALRRMTAIGTADVQTFEIKFDIAAAAAAPVIDAYAVKSNQMPLGAIVKTKRFPASSATSGLKEIDNIPKEGRILAIHLFKSDISKVEVEVDDAKVYELKKVLGAGIQVDHGRNPDNAVHTSVDFHLEGDPSQALVMNYVDGQGVLRKVQDFRIRPTLDTAGAFDIVVEYLTEFNGI